MIYILSYVFSAVLGFLVTKFKSKNQLKFLSIFAITPFLFCYFLIEYYSSLTYQGGGASFLSLTYFFIGVPSTFILVASYFICRAK
jgi:hypothetical protein